MAALKKPPTRHKASEPTAPPIRLVITPVKRPPVEPTYQFAYENWDTNHRVDETTEIQHYEKKDGIFHFWDVRSKCQFSIPISLIPENGVIHVNTATLQSCSVKNAAVFRQFVNILD